MLFGAGKKLFLFVLFMLIILLFCWALVWTEHRFLGSSLRLIYPEEEEITISNVSMKFRIILDGNLIVEEDFNNRPKNTVFKQLRGNITVKVNQSDIGELSPISTEGEAKEFTLHKIFRPTITQTDKILFMYVFQKFVDLCNKHNITFFMYDGTLIGSYRHHGFIPWDDDIDVFVNSSQKQLLAREGGKVPGFQVYTEKRFQWKFFHRKISTSIDGTVFRWPYIDIFFWDVSPSQFYDYTYLRKGKTYEQAVVFPLQPRPFEGALLMAPFKTEAFLKKKYDIIMCQTNTYSHRYELSNRWYKKIPCEKLEEFYPIVKHYHIISCKEHLVYKGEMISTFTSEGC